jgi:predicted nucleic acid-binding protein
MRPVVLDSSVLLGLWDPDDVHHRAASAALIRHLSAGHRIVVPVSVLSEVLVGAFRTTPHAVRTVEGFLDDLVSEVRPVDRAVGRAAAQYCADHPGLRLADALVIATGRLVDAEEILTADKRWEKVDPRVRVVE